MVKTFHFTNICSTYERDFRIRGGCRGWGGIVKGCTGNFATLRTFKRPNKANLKKPNNTRTGEAADHSLIFPSFSQEPLTIINEC